MVSSMDKRATRVSTAGHNDEWFGLLGRYWDAVNHMTTCGSHNVSQGERDSHIILRIDDHKAVIVRGEWHRTIIVGCVDGQQC